MEIMELLIGMLPDIPTALHRPIVMAPAGHILILQIQQPRCACHLSSAINRQISGNKVVEWDKNTVLALLVKVCNCCQCLIMFYHVLPFFLMVPRVCPVMPGQ